MILCAAPVRQVPEELDAGPEEAGHDGQGAAEGAVRGGAAAAGVLHRPLVLQAPRLRHVLETHNQTLGACPAPLSPPRFGLQCQRNSTELASTKPVVLLFEVRFFSLTAVGVCGAQVAGETRALADEM